MDQDTKTVLLGGNSKLRPLYDLMIARESGDWDGMTNCTRQLGLSDSEVSQAYWQAMQWARQIQVAWVCLVSNHHRLTASWLVAELIIRQISVQLLR